MVMTECVASFHSEVRVEGLETLDFLDNLAHRKRFTEQADAITFDGEVGNLVLMICGLFLGRNLGHRPRRSDRVVDHKVICRLIVCI